METTLKRQFLLCWVESDTMLTDVSLASHGIDSESRETFRFEVMGAFDSRFEAIKHLNDCGASISTFTIIETFQIETQKEKDK